MTVKLITKHDEFILENIVKIEYNKNLDTYRMENEQGNNTCMIRSYLVERIQIDGQTT